MKKNKNKSGSGQLTRREFVGRALTTAGVMTAAPAFLRGQNLNNKLNIAFIACGGRAESIRSRRHKRRVANARASAAARSVRAHRAANA